MHVCVHALLTHISYSKNICAYSATTYAYILVSRIYALQPHTYRNLDLSVFATVVRACATCWTHMHPSLIFFACRYICLSLTEHLRLSLVPSDPATWPLCACDLCTVRGVCKRKTHSHIYIVTPFTSSFSSTLFNTLELFSSSTRQRSFNSFRGYSIITCL